MAIAIGLSGCALVPVQQQTLTNAEGRTLTCKQVGAGIISAHIGEQEFMDCLTKAQALGYK